MFKNRTFNALAGLTIAVLAVLSIGTLAFTHRTPSISTDNRSAPLDWYFSHDYAILDGDNNVVSGVNIPVNERYSALKDKQLERSDAAQFARANIAAVDEEDSYQTMQPSASGWWEYRDDSLTNKWYAYHYVMTPTGPVIDTMSQGKSEGAARSDAAQFAGVNIAAVDEEDSDQTMQPFASGWWEYRDDSLTNKWYAYHYVMTPTGLVIDAMSQGKSEGAVNGCGLSRIEPDC